MQSKAILPLTEGKTMTLERRIRRDIEAKIRSGQLRPGDPPHLLAKQRPRSTLQLAAEKVQLHPPIGILMGRRQHFPANLHRDAELLPKLADQARVDGLIRLALAARKLPMALQVHAGKPSGDQITALRLDHGRGVRTLYAHMSEFDQRLHRGATVYEGQAIGRMGMTGNATGVHLHYEVWVDGLLVDPLHYGRPPTYVSAPAPADATLLDSKPAY